MRLQFIKYILQLELNLARRKRERCYGTMIHFLFLGTQLWQNDWHMYEKPGLRVDVWAEIQLNIFSSARVGEFLEFTCRSERHKVWAITSLTNKVKAGSWSLLVNDNKGSHGFYGSLCTCCDIDYGLKAWLSLLTSMNLAGKHSFRATLLLNIIPSKSSWWGRSGSQGSQQGLSFRWFHD